MKVSDYIVNYLYEIGIKDLFGYQGTMIAYFIDSIYKNKKVKNHVCYNEQGAALEAVGYAKTTGNISCAYSTSGPGATNLITGIADAYYDSAPVIFITGQLNSYEYTGIKTIRQQGFQECNIVEMVKTITKYAKQITNPNDIAYELEKAVYEATTKRKGPVLLDIPMNIQRTEINVKQLHHFKPLIEEKVDYVKIAKKIIEYIRKSSRPILLLGNGIEKDKTSFYNINKMIELLKIPVIYSMIAKSFIRDSNAYNFGFMGTAYGQRYANLIACKKTDLIISLGCRMNGRTIGLDRSNFNPEAQIIRIDIDKEELKYNVHNNDIKYLCDVNKLIDTINKVLNNDFIERKDNWLKVCNTIKEKLKNIDDKIPEHLPNKYISVINKYAGKNTNYFVDVGQNQVWAAHSIKINYNQKIIFSGGLGAMGFALPAAIGGCIANNREKTFVIAGDGGLQMNIQELQTLKMENLPITIFVFNNSSLGLIHQQQSDFFNNNYCASVKEGGYDSPNFKDIGKSYKIKSYSVKNIKELEEILQIYNDNEPTLIEIKLKPGTKAYPKTAFGYTMINQKPELDKKLIEELLSL